MFHALLLTEFGYQDNTNVDSERLMNCISSDSYKKSSYGFRLRLGLLHIVPCILNEANKKTTAFPKITDVTQAVSRKITICKLLRFISQRLETALGLCVPSPNESKLKFFIQLRMIDITYSYQNL